MKRLIALVTSSSLFAFALPALADSDMMPHGAQGGGMMGYGPGAMGGGFGAASLFGVLWLLIWTINSILFGILLWVLIQKFSKK